MVIFEIETDTASEAERTGHLIFTSMCFHISPLAPFSSLVICLDNKIHENHF